ncbi:MAG: hypothetical protein JO307_05715 [Bryobacterales bacterium]|nr:hypothetical protein [Bryobacterales bacterium]MBV9401812.1 hypothetical protein [Bryobacterales bacterium]
MRCRKLRPDRPLSICDAHGRYDTLNLLFRPGEIRGDALHCHRDVLPHEAAQRPAARSLDSLWHVAEQPELVVFFRSWLEQSALLFGCRRLAFFKLLLVTNRRLTAR